MKQRPSPGILSANGHMGSVDSAESPSLQWESFTENERIKNMISILPILSHHGNTLRLWRLRWWKFSQKMFISIIICGSLPHFFHLALFYTWVEKRLIGFANRKVPGSALLAPWISLKVENFRLASVSKTRGCFTDYRNQRKPLKCLLPRATLDNLWKKKNDDVSWAFCWIFAVSLKQILPPKQSSQSNLLSLVRLKK